MCSNQAHEIRHHALRWAYGRRCRKCGSPSRRRYAARMANPRRNKTRAAAPKARSTSAQAGTRTVRLRPATRALKDVLAERGPLTGPITDAGTKALSAVRGEPNDRHGRR